MSDSARPLRIAVLGAGGVGALVAAALAQQFPAETFLLARGENLAAIREQGIRVESVKLGDFVARPALVSDHAADIGPVDVVILACKGHQLEEACRTVAPLLREETVVLPLLNGVMVSEMIAPLLPPCVVADGTIHVFSALTAPGQVRQTAGLCAIALGHADGRRPPVFDALAARLTACGLPTTVSQDIRVDSWVKYVIMCGNSTIFCHYDAPAGTVREQAGFETVVRAVSGELLAVAAALGVALPEGLGQRHFDEFLAMPPATVTSLYRDLRAGKPAAATELAHVIGRLVTLGEAAGVDTPYHRGALTKWQ